ncbi:MAG: TolC family protein [Bdellovibrionota bacterium]
MRASFSLILILLLVIAEPARAVSKLDPQTVVDLALSKGLRARQAELTAQRSYLGLAQALGVFDFNVTIATGYEYDEAQSISQNSNPLTKSMLTTVLLEKRFSTGTTLSLDYTDWQRNSTLSSFAASSGQQPDATLNAVQLGLRQALLRNSFGYADRLAVEAARSTVDAAMETREESLEGILLETMTLFWTAYIAEQQLQQNLSARDKYDQLVKNVRRRAGFNLSSPGELPRLEAEYAATLERVKTSSANYLNAIRTLRTALLLEGDDELQLVIPAEIPPVPQLSKRKVEELRGYRVARTTLENANRTLDSYGNRARPQLDLIARAKSTGVDSDSGRALAEMGASTYPTYYVGVEFKTPLGSESARGVLAEAEVQKQIAEADLMLQRNTLHDELENQERTVAANYSKARLAQETVTLRERVVREMESAYRVGRQPLVELIRSYNELFAAQLSRAQAVGQYHIALNALAAARDELVTNVRR